MVLNKLCSRCQCIIPYTEKICDKCKEIVGTHRSVRDKLYYKSRKDKEYQADHEHLKELYLSLTYFDLRLPKRFSLSIGG